MQWAFEWFTNAVWVFFKCSRPYFHTQYRTITLKRYSCNGLSCVLFSFLYNLHHDFKCPSKQIHKKIYLYEFCSKQNYELLPRISVIEAVRCDGVKVIASMKLMNKSIWNIPSCMLHFDELAYVFSWISYHSTFCTVTHTNARTANRNINEHFIRIWCYVFSQAISCNETVDKIASHSEFSP